MAIFKIVHITKYQYNWPIKESINEIRLFPHNFENQDVLQYEPILPIILMLKFQKIIMVTEWVINNLEDIPR